MLRLAASVVLCISTLATCTQAQQPAAMDLPSAPPFAGARLLAQPITVLDYVLFRMDNSLKESAPIIKGVEFWQGSSAGGIVMPTDVTTMAFVADSGKIVVGYDISTGSMTRPVREVCKFIIGIVSNATGSDISREFRVARDNSMSHFMPRSTAAIASRETRSSAYDQLQQRMSIVVSIYEHSRRYSTTCERPVLSDSVSIRGRSIGQER